MTASAGSGSSRRTGRRPRTFGVVVTVPPTLARQADRIRRHYDPNYALIGPHITILPPRKLFLPRSQVEEVVRRAALRTPRFPLRLSGIGSFAPVMPVLFVGVSRGRKALQRLHHRLARGILSSPEAFPYVPHLTLGQELSGKRLANARDLSRKVFAGAWGNFVWRPEFLVIVERLSSRRWNPLPPIALGPVRMDPPGR